MQSCYAQSYSALTSPRHVQKQLAYMLGCQQIFLESAEELDDGEELVEIMSNSQLNTHFLSLAREVGILGFTYSIILKRGGGARAFEYGLWRGEGLCFCDCCYLLISGLDWREIHGQMLGHPVISSFIIFFVAKQTKNEQT